MKGVIRVGDRTSHGGQVVTGCEKYLVDGKPIARVGDECTCPVHGHTGVKIVEGHVNIIVDGKPMALHGFKTSCGATLITSMEDHGAEEGKAASKAQLNKKSKVSPEQPLKSTAPIVSKPKSQKPQSAKTNMPYAPDATPDKDMCFPMKQRPKPNHGYKEGGRQFGARRDGGRRHAGCDLLAPHGTPVYAMADGVFVRGPYEFYAKTYAIEVLFDCGIYARYGEISKSLGPGIGMGSRFKRGQVIGYTMKNHKDGACMLHLELYSNTSSGSLKSNKGPFQRRSDLLNPTSLLDALPLP